MNLYALLAWCVVFTYIAFLPGVMFLFRSLNVEKNAATVIFLLSIMQFTVISGWADDAVGFLMLFKGLDWFQHAFLSSLNGIIFVEVFLVFGESTFSKLLAAWKAKRQSAT